MLTELHGSVERLVHDFGRVPSEDVDVTFDAPKRDWVASLTRPTLNFFLYSLKENTDLRTTNLQTSRGNGSATYRVPPRRFDLRFMVSALTNVVEDEHLLLWRTLVTLLKYQTFPDEVLPPALRALDPPLVTQISKPDDTGELMDVWSGLETPPRPALLYVVTAPVELDITIESPLVLTRTTRYRRVRGLEAPADSHVHIGGTVRDKAGGPVAGAAVSVVGSAAAAVLTDVRGEFRLTGLIPGHVTLHVARGSRKPAEVTVDVPSPAYDIVID